MHSFSDKSKKEVLIDDIKEMKKGSYEEMWLITVYGLSSYFKSLFSFGFSSNVTRDNLNVIKEMFGILTTERRLLNYILKNLDQFHIESTEDVISMLDSLNDKTVEYYYHVIEDIEDACECGQEFRGTRPRKEFDTLTQSDSYASEVVALALDKNAIKEFLGFEDEFWKFVQEREKEDFKVSYETASNMVHVIPVYSDSIISDVKFFIPGVVDLRTALLAVQAYQKIYAIYKCIGRSKVEVLVSEAKSEEFENKYGRKITLAVVLVGENPASQVYVRNKIKATETVGMKSLSFVLPETATYDEVAETVTSLANDANVDGILVQLPLPKHLDENKILSLIPADKDVDGFLAESIGNLVLGNETTVACTPFGVIKMLQHENFELKGKNAVVLGRSNIVGKPMAMLLLKEDCTVTICHSKTVGLKDICKNADILVAAIGKPKFVTADIS